MDKYDGKRAVDRDVVSRKGMPHVFRTVADIKDRSVQLCSRPNCSSRIHSSIVAENSSCRKGKSLRPSTQSSLSGKEAVGRSCRTFSGISNQRKSLKEPRQTLSSRLETDSSETSSSMHDEPPSAPYQSQLQAEQGHAESDNVMVLEVASTIGVSRTRSQRNFHQPGLHGQETKSIGSVTRASTSRYNLRNVKCNSINDVSSTGSSSSSSDSTMNRRKDIVKERNYGRKRSSTSTARGNKLSGSLLEGQNSGSGIGISISDPRRSRNIPTHRDNIASVRTRRSISGNARERLPSHGNAHPIQPNESPLPHELVFPHHASAESTIIRLSAHSRPGSSDGQPTSPAEYNVTFPLRNRSRLQHQNSIAEVLLALERIEQDEELTEEEIRLLETNFLLNGPYLYDQHRDMRMDIDNMSYEELLALEERMGTVTIALTEEALSGCLERSIYQSTPSDDNGDDESSNIINDHIKCSICQDEYVIGDEVGSLQCEHGFHVACIQQWLGLKNWCPICKASAAPSESSNRT